MISANCEVAAPAGGVTGLDDAALGMAQRLMLSTDATVVRLLEACFGEPVRTAGLVQVSTPAFPGDVELELGGGETVQRRETLLQGSRTGRNYVYAEAAVVLDRLEPRLQEALVTTSQPIGYLLVAQRVETFRELLRTGRTPAGVRGASFGLRSSDLLLLRTYRVIAGGRPVMLITEYFPPSFFPAPPAADPDAGRPREPGP